MPTTGPDLEMATDEPGAEMEPRELENVVEPAVIAESGPGDVVE